MINSVCITILVLSLLVVPITVVADGEIDVFKNDGYIDLSLFGLIRLFKSRAYLKHLDPLHNNLIVEGKKKDYEFHINADKKDKQSIIKLFDIDFMPYINIVRLDLDVSVGKRDDALFTTMTLGGLRIVFYSIFSALKCSQKLEVGERFVAEYNTDIFKTAFGGIINISIADIIFSFLLYLTKKMTNSGGKKVDNRA